MAEKSIVHPCQALAAFQPRMLKHIAVGNDDCKLGVVILECLKLIQSLILSATPIPMRALTALYRSHSKLLFLEPLH
jgi:hypothetical protein